MAIQPNKPQNRIFLIVGVVLAAAAAVAVLFAVSKSAGGSTGPTVNVVVAKSTIAAGTSITSDLLTTTALPQSSVPSDALTDPSQVVGKLAPVTLSANFPLTASLFSSVTGTGGTALPQLDITKGYVALAIPAAGAGGSPGVSAELTSVGFYIQPEDHIDILIDTGTPGAPNIRYAFQDVRVLRVGAAQATSGSSSSATTASAGAVNSYIIELPRNQAEIMTALITARPGPTGAITTPIVLKYLMRPQSEWGKRDGSNGFDKPNYESNTGTPVGVTADTPVTAATLTALFPH